LPDVLANLALLVSILIKELFPTLERPIKAYSGKLGAGQRLTSELLITNVAVLIIISGKY
jgi:hypothetical protein